MDEELVVEVVVVVVVVTGKPAASVGFPVVGCWPSISSLVAVARELTRVDVGERGPPRLPGDEMGLSMIMKLSPSRLKLAPDQDDSPQSCWTWTGFAGERLGDEEAKWMDDPLWIVGLVVLGAKVG